MMKILIAVLLTTTAAMAEEKVKCIQPTDCPAPGMWRLIERIQIPPPSEAPKWSMLFDLDMTTNKPMLPLYYWKQFETEQDCLAGLRFLRKQRLLRSDVSNIRCAETP